MLARLLVVFFAYVALAAWWTYPLVTSLASSVPHDLGDAVLNTWIMWWNAHQRPLTAAWWDAPIFYPARGAIAFSEHLLALAPFTTVVQRLGGTPLLAHNLTLLLAFPLCAVTAYVLVHALTRRHDAALVGGTAFGFSPYWVAHLPQVQLLAGFGMPVALLALHRYAESGRRRWLAAFGVAWLFTALANGYYLLFFPVLLGLWLLWFTPPWRRPGDLTWIAGAWLVASLPLAPILLGYRAVHQALGLSRGREYIIGFGADLTSLLEASPHLWLWRSPIAFHRAEGELFPGVTIVMLTIAGLAAVWRASASTGVAPGDGLRRVRRGLAGIAGLSALVWLLLLVVGRIDATLAGVRLVIAGPERPALWASVALVAWAATSRRVRQAYRRADPLLFYALATAAAWLFALGPTPRVLGTRFWQAGPYAWLLSLPGYDAIRVPARFAAVATLCLAVAAGLAAARLITRGPRWRWGVSGLVAAAIVAEGWIARMPLVPVPTPQPLGDLAPRAVLELPMGGAAEDLSAMFRAMSHGVPLVNGYSGHEPSHYTALRMALDARDPAILDELARSTAPLAIVIDRRADSAGAWVRFVGAHPDARLVREEVGHLIYWLPGLERVTSHAAQPLSIQAIAANRREAFTGPLFDGNLDTAWSTEAPQDGAEEVIADLGHAATVVGVRLWLGRLVTHAPRVLEIDVSADGRTWTSAWQGATAPLIYRGALVDQRRVPLTIDIPTQPARFLRLRQVGRTSEAPWTMGEVEVLGPAAEARTAGEDPPPVGGAG